MIKPNAEEVTAYALSISFKLNGNHFCDYYESKGWMVGKSPMKNWQAAVRTWKHNSPESAFVGKKYDSSRMEAKQQELRDLAEREWEKRNIK